MQPRETINQLSYWTNHQVTAADLQTQIGCIVTPIPTRRSNNRFDCSEESSKDSEVEEEYLDCGSYDDCDYDDDDVDVDVDVGDDDGVVVGFRFDVDIDIGGDFDVDGDVEGDGSVGVVGGELYDYVGVGDDA